MSFLLLRFRRSMSTIFSYQQTNSAKGAHTLLLFYCFHTTPNFFSVLLWTSATLFLVFFSFKESNIPGLLPWNFKSVLFVFSVINQGLGRQKFSSKSQLVPEFLILMKFEEFSTKIQTFHWIFTLQERQREKCVEKWKFLSSAENQIVLRSRLELTTEFHYQM